MSKYLFIFTSLVALPVLAGSLNDYKDYNASGFTHFRGTINSSTCQVKTNTRIISNTLETTNTGDYSAEVGFIYGGCDNSALNNFNFKISQISYDPTSYSNVKLTKCDYKDKSNDYSCDSSSKSFIFDSYLNNSVNNLPLIDYKMFVIKYEFKYKGKPFLNKGIVSNIDVMYL